jgi:hypothetical protein
LRVASLAVMSVRRRGSVMRSDSTILRERERERERECVRRGRAWRGYFRCRWQTS